MAVLVWAGLVAAGVVGFVVLPRVLFAVFVRRGPTWAPWLLWVAAGLFVIGWVLPDPSLAATSTFTQHAVGGGASSAVAAVWFAVNAGVRSPLFRLAIAYAVTAGLGTGVELAELVLDEVVGSSLTEDAVWDLLANTTGAVAAALVVEAGLAVSRAGRRRA